MEQLPAFIPYLLIRESEVTPVGDFLRRHRTNFRIALHVKDKRIKDDRLNEWVLLRLDPDGEPGL